MNDRERITRLEIRCEQLQLTVNEAFHWIDILKSDLSDLQDKVGYADRKDEPTISKMEQVDEPKWTKENCKGCKYNEYPYDSGTCFVRVCINGNKYEPKDEPQTNKGGCSNCAGKDICTNAFTEVSQYCGAYEPKNEQSGKE